MLYFYAWLAVQILLESFPVSSSGHCLLFENYLNTFACHMNYYKGCFLTFTSVNNISINLLEHFIHGVTLVVVACFFFSRWFFLLSSIGRCWWIICKIMVYVFVADMCTAVLYVVFKNGYQPCVPLWFGFVITALTLLSMLWCTDNFRTASLSLKTACMLGIVQGCALVPGISRFAVTYVCARWLGFASHKAFEVSWLIFVPLMGVAFLHSSYVLLFPAISPILYDGLFWSVLIGSGILAYSALKLVADMAYKNQWWIFGIYMILSIIMATTW